MARGRKPDLKNVIPMKSDDGLSLQERAERAAADLKPLEELTEEEGRVWDRLAPELYKEGRLKGLFVDELAEYCRVYEEIKRIRAFLAENGGSYRPGEGRNGNLIKRRPEIQDLKEAIDNWKWHVGRLGLSPMDERGLIAGQGNLFPDGNDFAKLGRSRGDAS